MGKAIQKDLIRRIEARSKVPAIFAQKIEFTKFTFTLISVDLYAMLGSPGVEKHYEYNADKDLMSLSMTFYNQLLPKSGIMTQIDIRMDIPWEFFGKGIKSSRDIPQSRLNKVLERGKIVVIECLHQTLPELIDDYVNHKYPMCGKKSVVRRINKIVKETFL